MSKYTRLNKITHYHDSCSRRQQPEPEPQLVASTNFNIISMDNNNSNESTSTLLSGFSSRQKLATKTNLVARNIQNNNNNKMHISSGSLTRKQSNNLNKLAFFAYLSILLITLFAVIQGVESLNCYHCSSVDNPACDEHFTGRNVTETDCEKAIGRPARVCRKIVQYIEHKKVVIRSCGYIDDHDEKDRKPMCNKRSGTFAIMMESCNCYTDLCNHSASLVPNQSVLLLVSLASCSFVFYNSLVAKRR